MEFENRTLDSSWSILGAKDFAGKPNSGEIPEVSDGFVALDIESLSLLSASSASYPIVDSCKKIPIAGNHVPFKKTLSKKELLAGADRRAAESDTITAGKDSSTTTDEKDATSLPSVKTPKAAGIGIGNRSRRIVGRRPGLRLDPRRVMVLFATLSSIGTLILLYFTISFGKMQITELSEG